MPFVFAIERQDVHIAGNGDNRVSFAAGVDAEGRAADAAAADGVFLVASADLHVVTTDTRCRDRSSIPAGVHLSDKCKIEEFLVPLPLLPKRIARLGNLGQEKSFVVPKNCIHCSHL